MNPNGKRQSFNLIDEPWIPVTDGKGQYHEVGLKELYEKAAKLEDLAVDPPQRIALTRLLLCISQTALNGPEDEDDWKTAETRIVPESLAYLEKHRDRFDLFGEKPFLQVPANQLKIMNNARTDKLDLGLASGGNGTVFDQMASPNGRYHPESWIARLLLAYQSFSPGGLIGKTEWNKTQGSGSSSDSPCIEASMLMGILKGQTLLETIHWNMVPFELLKQNNMKPGKPVWELDLKGPNDKQAMLLTESYFGRLVPFSRVILIDPNLCEMTLANGFSYPKLPEVREPMGSVVQIPDKKEGFVKKYVRVDPQKHPWRNFGAILAHLDKEKKYVGGALILEHLLKLKSSTQYQLWVGGVLSDKAKILDAVSWNVSLNTAYLGNFPLETIKSGVGFSNLGAYKLQDAVKVYIKDLKEEQDSLSIGSFVSRAKAEYWSILDSKHDQLLEIAAGDHDLTPWKMTLAEAKLTAYEKTCPALTPRQIQAFAAGKRELWKIKEKAKTPNAKTTAKTADQPSKSRKKKEVPS